MAKNNGKMVEAITSMDEDFAKWYTDVVTAAKLARYSNVKGCIIYEPNGTAIWEKIKEVLDKKFKETGHPVYLFGTSDVSDYDGVKLREYQETKDMVAETNGAGLSLLPLEVPVEDRNQGCRHFGIWQEAYA